MKLGSFLYKIPHGHSDKYAYMYVYATIDVIVPEEFHLSRV